jgi:hypothetical protein
MELVPVSDDGTAKLMERYQLMAEELSPELLRDRTIEYALFTVPCINTCNSVLFCFILKVSLKKP